MSYVVTIFTEKHLYRVNIEEGTKYTIGSGEKDAFPMSELGVDGQLGICFHAKKQILKLNAKKIPLSVKEMKEEAKLVNICEFPKIEVRFTRDTGEYSESYPIPYECQIHIGRSKKNDIVLNDSYVSRNHLFITSERGKIRIEDLGSKYGTYLNGSPLKKAMLKSGDEIDICDLRIICKENTLYFYNLHETPELKYQKEINHPGMATNIVSMQKGYPVYHRSPRIRESLPVDEVRLSHLPNKPQRFSIRKANFLPLLSSGAMAGASFAMSSFSPAMLAMRAAMMISPVGSLIGNSNKKARKMLMVEEEERFQKTIDQGMALLNDLIDKADSKVFSGDNAFTLNDTYGFPLDLTKEILSERGMTVDEESFRQLMQEQKQRAREARKALGDLGWAGVEFGKDIPATEFVGYDHDELDATVVALVAEDELRGEIPAGSDAVVVLDKSPFYAEMGGQVADHGTISAPGMLFTVTDVQKNKGGKFMHYGQLTEGALHVGDTVHAAIDTQRRKAIRRAHSATHLLDAALKKVLGDHVHQAGSLVEPDRLRFDFTHFEAITPDQLHQVEELVNDAILEGYPVVTEVLPIEEAKKKGAVAMFGEKYGDTVRVVEMGDVSIEFCGGTHVDNTAKAGPFRVKSETSVASGVRRIEATCGKLSLQGMERSQGVLHKAAQFLKTAPAGLLERMEQQANEMKQLRQALDKLKAEASLGEAKQFLASAKTVRGLHVITTTRTGMDVAAMRTMGDFLRDKDPGVVAVIASINGEKVSFLAVCGKEAVARGIKAGDLVRSVSAVCGGKGGGKPDSAMGGGTELLKVDDALAAVDDFVSEKIS